MPFFSWFYDFNVQNCKSVPAVHTYNLRGVFSRVYGVPRVHRVSSAFQRTNEPISTFMIQIAVLANHQNGRDTHMRQIKVYTPVEESSIGKFPRCTTVDFMMYRTIRWSGRFWTRFCVFQDRRNRTVLMNVCANSLLQDDEGRSLKGEPSREFLLTKYETLFIKTF